MDPTKLIAPPPSTSDPITWIALAAFCVAVIVFLWVVMFGLPKALAALAEERESALTKFGEEQDKQRAHDTQRATAIHNSLNEIKSDVRALAAQSR